MKTMVGLIAGALMTSLPAQQTTTSAPLSANNNAWYEPAEPLRLVGPIHYVGTRDLAAYLIATPQGPNNEGGPSSAPANGGVPGKQDNYLHSNPYPNTASPGQPKECEAGNEPFLVGKQVYAAWQ